MNWKRRIVAMLLGILFGWYITPKELMHVFQHHNDTEHHATDGLRLESAHHHCSLMKVDQSLCSNEPPVFFQLTEPIRFFSANAHVEVYVAEPIQSIKGNKKSRGPPAMV
ncbi:MAG: hypothetical protein ACR2IL_10065 [Chitinophagaceae bacterium]